MRSQDRLSNTDLKYSQETRDLKVTEAPLFDDEIDGVVLEEGSGMDPCNQGQGYQIYIDSLLSTDRKRTDSPKLNRPPPTNSNNHNLIIAAPEAGSESPELSMQFKEFSGNSPQGFKPSEVSPITNQTRPIPGIQNHFYSVPKPFQLSNDHYLQRGSDGFIEREIHVPFDTQDDCDSASKLGNDRSNQGLLARDRQNGTSKLTMFLQGNTERPASSFSRESKDRTFLNSLQGVQLLQKDSKSRVVSNNNFLRVISPLHQRPPAKTQLAKRQSSPINKISNITAQRHKPIDEEALLRVQKKNENRRNPRVGVQSQSRLMEALMNLKSNNRPFQKKTSTSIITSQLQNILDRTNQVKSRTNSRTKEPASNLSVGQISKINSKTNLVQSRTDSSSKKQLLVEGFRPSSSRGNSIGGTAKPQPIGLGSAKGSSSSSALFSKLMMKGTRSGQGNSLEGRTRINITENETSTNSVAVESSNLKPTVNSDFQQMLKRIHAPPKPIGVQSAASLLIPTISSSNSTSASILLSKPAHMISTTSDRQDKSPALLKKTVVEGHLATQSSAMMSLKRPDSSSRFGSSPLGELLNMKPKQQTVGNGNLIIGLQALQTSKGPYPGEQKSASQKKLELAINVDNVAPVKAQQNARFASQSKLINYISHSLGEPEVLAKQSRTGGAFI